MIGKLTGLVDSIDSEHLILDVQGVGYFVHASSRTLSKIGSKGSAASLLIETQVREDAITLYGFADALEQEWFTLLNSVQGVGAKAALSILAACPPERLALVISSQDKASIQAANGVGPKLALRVITELKDKAGKMDLSPKTVDRAVDQSVDSNQGGATLDPSVENDALSALENLGYARSDAYQAIQNARNDNHEELQDIIRAALKELSA